MFLLISDKFDLYSHMGRVVLTFPLAVWVGIGNPKPKLKFVWLARLVLVGFALGWLDNYPFIFSWLCKPKETYYLLPSLLLFVSEINQIQKGQSHRFRTWPCLEQGV